MVKGVEKKHLSSKMSMSFFLQSKRNEVFWWKHSRIFSI